MKINPTRYSTSFTTGSLFRHESVKLAALYLEVQDWKIVRTRVVADNLLQARRLSSSQRICSEVISRLKGLTLNELIILIDSNSKDQAYLLWLAICRRYKLIEEFACEVLHERYVSRKHDLNKEPNTTFESQAIIRETQRRFEESDYQQLLEQVTSWPEQGQAHSRATSQELKNSSNTSAAQNKGHQASASAPQRQTRPEVEYVSIKSVTRTFKEVWLAEESNVGNYVVSLKEALLTEISKGQRIQI